MDMGDANNDDVDSPDETDAAAPAQTAVSGPRQVSISLRTLLFGALVLALAAGLGVFAWLYVDARSELDAQARQAAGNQRAEQVAMDYAVAAAQMDFRDLNAWKGRLVAGTSPELTKKLGEAADSMEQILTPLQWESTARPLAAVVRSSVGGAYVVDAFVSVLTKTTQAPQGLQSTATYSVTIDSNQDWLITDVGGIDAVVGAR
ncbi:hypothetical protein QGN32_11170 [Mycolicibacterium sp. ND9-15]|uniref:hypothetical protein n=1 Tax=Mycolicibacterium sp. ND9-15 TaxID=3042320 RepID=UPI002DDB45B4|nr:hypothetical protein [Mycolicibacterium sp. ND9-15]WSE58365.1 hypothetical protein QGN32_11170 [Mycolicibacterium sp. ND9-15]